MEQDHQQPLPRGDDGRPTPPRPAPVGHDPEARLSTRATGRLLAIIGVVLMLLTWSVALDLPVTSRLDHAVARWGYDRTYEQDMRTSLWGAVSHWGAPWALRLALVAAALAQLWRRRFGLAAWLVCVACLENIVAPVTKYGLSRQRPEWQSPIAVEHSLSYPSGHSAAAGMFITAFALLIVVTVRRQGRQFVLLGVVVLIGALVMASRIFLGVHYLSDVVAGFLLGSVIALLGWWMYLLCRRRRPATRTPTGHGVDGD